jgi:hypothetical protein
MSDDMEGIRSLAEKIGDGGVTLRSRPAEAGRLPKDVLLRAMKGEKC